ncbi:hypothetical protein [Fictibacillus barbaricus]|uniref:Uncharacterized protein n=1 Tax=Fictibacillus barbaricus TaxID=182136 RepID=A0ABU1U334_9BACL|nr:hypothetical protein [Fictibacillus barbaricus]MDR7073878.1 hypothetical protein [Fictibacillus barbaricus]
MKRTNVAHRLPRGKGASCSGNQPLSGATKYTIITILLTFYGKKIDYYWHIGYRFVYNEEYDSSRE